MGGASYSMWDIYTEGEEKGGGTLETSNLLLEVILD